MAATVLDRLVVQLGYKFSGDQFRKFVRSADQVKARLNEVADKVDKVGRKLQGIGVKGAAGLAGIAFAGIKVDAAMKTLAGITGATSDELAAFKAQALEVGSQLPLTTAEIIAAQTAFVQLGFSIEEALAATPAIARAAVASSTLDIESAARFAATAMNQFDLEAADVERVLDVLVKTEQNSAAKAVDLGNALRFSGQAADDANVPLEVYIAALGTLAGSGRSAEESSQGVNVLLSKLAAALNDDIGRGGKLAKDALGALNIEMQEVQAALEDTSGEGFIRLLQSISENAESLPQSTLTAALRALVGESYASSFSYLIQNTDQLERVAALNFDAQGTSAEQAALKMTGLSGAWESFKAQIDTAIILLSDAGIGQMLEKGFRWMTALLTKFVEAPKWVRTATGAIILFMAALLPLGLALRGVAVAFKGLAFFTGVYSAAAKAATAASLGTRLSLVALKVQTAAMAVASGIATAAQWLWNIAVAAFPIFLIVLAIAAAVAAIWYWRDEILAFLKVAWSKITEVFGAVLGWMKEWGPTLALLLFPPALFAAVIYKFREQIWDGVKSIFGWVVDFFKGLWHIWFDAGGQMMLALVKGILSVREKVKDAVWEVMKSARDLLPFSDAKEGPLKRLTESGRALPETFARGIGLSAGDVSAAFANAIPDPFLLTSALPVGPVPASPFGGGAAGAPRSVSVTIGTIQIDAAGGDAEMIAEKVSDAIDERIRAATEELDSPVRA